MEENAERCLKCGEEQGLQGHLFYLCAKCGNVDFEELLKVIRVYEGKKTT
jgi:predicted nucleic-acid-binding Zn-ribbon protein